MHPLFLFRRSGSCQNDDRLIRLETADLLQNCDPIHFRHIEIEHNDIRAFAAKEFQALTTTIGEFHVIALSIGKRVEETPYTLLFIDHEHFGHDTSQNKNGEASTTGTARLGSLLGKRISK
jgi:hypothetical protein